MEQRRRVNISVNFHTYRRLQRMRDRYGFRGVCEMVTALLNVFLDRVDTPDGLKCIDLNADDANYIDEMFEEFSHAQKMPDGTVPVRHKNKQMQ